MRHGKRLTAAAGIDGGESGVAERGTGGVVMDRAVDEREHAVDALDELLRDSAVHTDAVMGLTSHWRSGRTMDHTA